MADWNPRPFDTPFDVDHVISAVVELQTNEPVPFVAKIVVHQQLPELDLEVAGEFILMAATLIQIKVRMLLPRDGEALEEPEEDPRAELVRQILEYKRFKEVAESMTEMENHQRRLYPRSDFSWTKPFITQGEASGDEYMNDVDLFDLLTAFKKVLDEAPKTTSHQVGLIGVTVEEQIEYLMQTLVEKERITFAELMDTMTDKIFKVVTFMAILELIRTHQIRVQQASVFGEIWIQKG